MRNNLQKLSPVPMINLGSMAFAVLAICDATAITFCHGGEEEDEIKERKREIRHIYTSESMSKAYHVDSVVRKRSKIGDEGD